MQVPRCQELKLWSAADHSRHTRPRTTSSRLAKRAFEQSFEHVPGECGSTGLVKVTS